MLDRIDQLLTLDNQNDLVFRDCVAGRMLTMVASNAILKGASDATFSLSDVSDLIVAQAGEAISVAFVIGETSDEARLPHR